jgi:hypothetical protein
LIFKSLMTIIIFNLPTKKPAGQYQPAGLLNFIILFL